MSASKARSPVARTIVEFAVVILGAGILAYITYYLSSELHYFPGKQILIIYAVLAFVGGYLGIRIVTALLERMMVPKIGVTRTHGIKNVFQLAAGILLIVVVFGLLGFNLTSALIGAGFLGIVLGLAAQQVLGNIFAGILLLGSRPFEIGERLTIVTSTYGLLGQSYPHEHLLNGFTGVVEDVGIFFTKVRFDDGTPAVFPNSSIIGALIVNHSRVSERSTRVRMNLDVRIDYSTFKSNLLELINKEQNAMIDPGKSKVEIVDIGTATYQIVVIVWSRSAFEEPIKTIIIQNALIVQKDLTPKEI
ncbi:MAG: mechanosensitive ion channel family protein [Rhabdochlamydiaceae bacterium]